MSSPHADLSISQRIDLYRGHIRNALDKLQALDSKLAQDVQTYLFENLYYSIGAPNVSEQAEDYCEFMRQARKRVWTMLRVREKSEAWARNRFTEWTSPQIEGTQQLRSSDRSPHQHKQGTRRQILPVLSGRVIRATGNTPYDQLAIERIALLEGAKLGSKDRWQQDQLVVIGRVAFDKEYLLRSIEYGVDHNIRCSYVSQEDFWQLWLYGTPPAYSMGDPRIKRHPGLSFLASVGFRRPSTQAAPGIGTEGRTDGWRDTHPLASVYGYSVRQDIPEEIRRAALHKAILDENGSGLQAVATHVAWLIRNSKRRWDDHMLAAIQKWEADLDWLRKTYYEGTLASFVWPSYK